MRVRASKVGVQIFDRQDTARVNGNGEQAGPDLSAAVDLLARKA